MVCDVMIVGKASGEEFGDRRDAADGDDLGLASRELLRIRRVQCEMKRRTTC